MFVYLTLIVYVSVISNCLVKCSVGFHMIPIETGDSKPVSDHTHRGYLCIMYWIQLCQFHIVKFEINLDAVK